MERVQAGGLVDTGALLAALDPDDPWHAACAQALKENHPPYLTTTAVLTELFHLVRGVRRGVDGAWALVTSGAVRVVDVSHGDLPVLQALMTRYADCPMDFADATLVLMADRFSLSTVVTVDHADFETYRMKGNKRFRVLPIRPRR